MFIICMRHVTAYLLALVEASMSLGGEGKDCLMSMLGGGLVPGAGKRAGREDFTRGGKLK